MSDKMKLVSINSTDYDQVFEEELSAAIDNAYANGVRASTVIALLRVYEHMEVMSVAEAMYADD